MEISMRGLCPLIQVFDIDNSLRFYCELLGFEIVEKAEAGPPFAVFEGWE